MPSTTKQNSQEQRRLNRNAAAAGASLNAASDAATLPSQQNLAAESSSSNYPNPPANEARREMEWDQPHKETSDELNRNPRGFTDRMSQLDQPNSSNRGAENQRITNQWHDEQPYVA